MTTATITPTNYGNGTNVTGAKTAYEAMAAAGCDFTVRQEPLQIANPEWRSADAPIAHKALMKDDGTIFTVVGSKYHTVQPIERFAIADAAMSLGAELATVNNWDDGRTQVIQLRMPGGDSDIGGGDMVTPFLTILGGYDGKTSEQVMLTTMRSFCANQFQAMRHDAGAAMQRIRHTSGASDRMALAAASMTKVAKAWDVFTDTARTMKAARMKNVDQIAFVERFIGGDKDASDQRVRNRHAVAMAALAWERDNATGASDNVWTAFNAVTNATNHGEGIARAAPGSDRRSNALIRGRLADTNAKAFRAAHALAR